MPCDKTLVCRPLLTYHVYLQAYKALEKLVHYMDEMKAVADPTTLNSQVIEPVTYYLGLLDAASLAECFEKYSKPKTPYEEKLR